MRTCPVSVLELILLMAPSFPGPFPTLQEWEQRDGENRVSQQLKSCPCLLPPPEGVDTSVPKLSESGRSPPGHLPVYLNHASKATAAEMSPGGIISCGLETRPGGLPPPPPTCLPPAQVAVGQGGHWLPSTFPETQPSAQESSCHHLFGMMSFRVI